MADITGEFWNGIFWGVMITIGIIAGVTWLTLRKVLTGEGGYDE